MGCSSVTFFEQPYEMKFGKKGKIGNGFEVNILTKVFVNEFFRFDQMTNDVWFRIELFFDF
jgi:hypothetical protein